MLAKFRFLLSDLYDQYTYLMDGTDFSRAERRYFQRIHDGEASPVEMEEALRRLMDMMKRCHHQSVVLLLDEYDIPVQQAWEHGFYEECMAFMRNFLSAALKTNPSLDFAVLTGVLRIAKESIFSGLNNLEVSSVINGTYADWIGFTPEEVRSLAHDQQQDAALPVLHDWYDGYRFGEQEIYNPWSVLCFFKEQGQPQPYWAHTSGERPARRIAQADRYRPRGQSVATSSRADIDSSPDREHDLPRACRQPRRTLHHLAADRLPQDRLPPPRHRHVDLRAGHPQ